MADEDREALEREARRLINAEGSSGILVQMYVMMANDVRHLSSAVGEIRGILYVLVPLTVATLAFTAVSFFT